MGFKAVLGRKEVIAVSLSNAWHLVDPELRVLRFCFVRSLPRPCFETDRPSDLVSYIHEMRTRGDETGCIVVVSPL